MDVLFLLGVIALASLPGLIVLWLVWRRKPSRPIFIRAALVHAFLAGSILSLQIQSGINGIEPVALGFVRVSLAPIFAALALPELLSFGATTLVVIFGIALLTWSIVCARFPRKVAFALAIALGAITINASLLIEDQVQRRHIENQAELMGATCLNLRNTFSEALAARQSEISFFGVDPRPSHAGATIDGVHQIWSYREGRFITPETQIRCIPS